MGFIRRLGALFSRDETPAATREVSDYERAEFLAPIVHNVCLNQHYMDWSPTTRRRLDRVRSGIVLNMPIEKAIDLAIILGD